MFDKNLQNKNYSFNNQPSQNNGFVQQKNKLHKLDLIFIIGLIILFFLGPILGIKVDSFFWRDVEYGGFPIFTLLIPIIGPELLLFILLIYSFIKRKQNAVKPILVRGYMFFALPFISGFLTMVSLGFLVFIFQNFI